MPPLRRKPESRSYLLALKTFRNQLMLVICLSSCLSALTYPSRRSFMTTTVATSFGASLLSRQPSFAASEDSNNSTTSMSESSFRTLGYGQEEYTNSITASRDTNISPREAYDVIRERIPKAAASSASSRLRVLDVGAGAGVSTAVLYNELGYRQIDAVDWSADAWNDNVVECPTSVQFYALADDAFFQKQATISSSSSSPSPYDIICYNFAVNFRKAERVAQQHLTDTGLLLAPINEKADYWYKQTYYILNNQGKILWKSAPEVGAWSVQFQPDVTSDTCTGIWCRGFNGFR